MGSMKTSLSSEGCFEYSNKLIHYLRRKGISNLQISIVETIVESGPAEVLVEPLPDDRIEDLYNEKYRYVHVIDGGEELGGNIYVTSRGLEFDDHVFFQLSSFFGLKHITAKGIHAFRFR